MQLPPAGEHEGEVGHRAGPRGRLLAVAHALDQPGGAQHVVGHALTPLAPGLGAGQCLAQRLGGVGQLAAHRDDLGQAGLHPALLLGALPLEAHHQVGHAGQLAAQLTRAPLEALLADLQVVPGGGVELGAHPRLRLRDGGRHQHRGTPRHHQTHGDACADADECPDENPGYRYCDDHATTINVPCDS